MQKVIFPLVALVGFASAFLLYWAGAGYQSGTYELGQAFALMRYSAIAGISGTGLCIFLILWKRPGGIRLTVLFISALFGLAAFYMPYRQQLLAGMVPPIHDITTDTLNPPLFVDVLKVRANAPNPAEYDGPEVALQQKDAYPDLMPLVLVLPASEAFVSALALVEESGWELVGSSLQDGRIEATATTRWFGFKDDVVIRIKPGQTGSVIVDMRSKSRVGRSDIGANAARIRTFIAELKANNTQADE